MSKYPLITLLLSLGLASQSINAQQYAFNTEEETVEGWYHSHDIATWLAKGAERDVIEAVLTRVAGSSREKRIPELVDTQIEFAPGNWSYEWIQAGDAASDEAQRLSGEDKLQKLRAALTYYTTGSWPHLGREDDRQAHEKAVAAYLAAGALMTVPVQHVEFSVGQSTAKGYLHRPAGQGPFPFVINTFGSDVTKEDSLDLFHRELEPRGIGMLAVDMPGIGEASHLSLRDGSDAVLEGALNYLRRSELAMGNKIVIVGGSFGGNAAARAFYRLDVAAVVSMCAPLHSAFMLPPEALDTLPKLTIDGVKARFGVLDRPTEELAALISQTSLVEQGHMEATNQIDTPLLVVTTNRDPVSPLDDLEIFLETAQNNQTVILDMEGHCPPRNVREPLVARWVADQVWE